jgi:hypothetical protein
LSGHDCAISEILPFQNACRHAAARTHPVSRRVRDRRAKLIHLRDGDI